MLLLTGFEPFTTGQGLRLTHNPTGDIAKAIGRSNLSVEAAVLPVSFRETKATLRGLFAAHKPNHCIDKGRVEQRNHNFEPVA